MHIHITNLSRKTTIADIQALFAEFGAIVVSKLTYALDRHTQKVVGFVYVDVDDAAVGETAIKKFHGSILTGNKITVRKVR